MISFFRINLRLPHSQAAAVVALRLLIEEIIIRVANNPEMINGPTPMDEKLMSLIKILSRSNAGQHMLPPPNAGGPRGGGMMRGRGGPG